MATVSLWSGVAVAMQSALASSQVVSGVTKASPGVATYVGSDTYANGDIVLMTALGMYQINNRLFRVANVSTGSDTFELEGENTTAFDTFTSGSIEEVTFGTSISTLTGLTASGGDFDFIDTTTIHDLVKQQVPGAANPIVFSFESVWDVSDAGLLAMKTASDSKAQRSFRFTFANSQKLYFRGYVGCTLLPVGNAQDKVTTQVVITMNGSPTVYSS